LKTEYGKLTATANQGTILSAAGRKYCFDMNSTWFAMIN